MLALMQQQPQMQCGQMAYHLVHATEIICLPVKYKWFSQPCHRRPAQIAGFSNFQLDIIFILDRFPPYNLRLHTPCTDRHHRAATTVTMTKSAFVAPAPFASGPTSSRRHGDALAGLDLQSRLRPTVASHRSAIVCASAAGSESEEDGLLSEDYITRIYAVKDMRTRYSTLSEQVGGLVNVLSGDSNPQVRYMAVTQLSTLDRDALSDKDKEAILAAALVALKDDSDSSCQSGAADAIAGLGLVGGFDSLVEAFNAANGSDWMLRFSIAASIAELGHPRCYEFLVDVLEAANPTGDELLITAVLGGLGELRNTQALPIIEKYLDNPDKSIKERAAIAHELLTGI
jgi:hypothetical protein